MDKPPQQPTKWQSDSSLCSVSRICDKGNTVTFQAEEGFIENPDGVRIHFRRENNVYVMDLPFQRACFAQTDKMSEKLDDMT